MSALMKSKIDSKGMVFGRVLLF